MLDEEEARTAAISSLGLNKAVPDALVTDRWFLPNYMKALAIEAVKRDAPEGVVEDLMLLLRRATRNAKGIDEYGVEVLARLEGLRDVDEIVPVLERARDEAPDESRRQRIERLLKKARQPGPSREDLRAMSDEQLEETLLSDNCDSCCLYGCSLCLLECFICCIGTCYCCQGGCG
ncbi:hypothetical protein [Streptomyces sp. NBC_00503]|uniref:hypothetical protein n=1 Tax=Streptomyces sp. NBC_00503 TaxID=2903659 RepID=UPI002E7FE9C6|nr:hypothetical protein [Streptomyces sp. NBC_00503]WUD79113.1 hypothetical protein OG490_00055 [Streptomyces sp. NBC_00503]